ncbi:MAG: hypothetical protein HRF40_13150 [Nitrososphaera sp.]|jgi:hypothetical protein
MPLIPLDERRTLVVVEDKRSDGIATPSPHARMVVASELVHSQFLFVLTVDYKPTPSSEK